MDEGEVVGGVGDLDGDLEAVGVEEGEEDCDFVRGGRGDGDLVGGTSGGGGDGDLVGVEGEDVVFVDVGDVFRDAADGVGGEVVREGWVGELFFGTREVDTDCFWCESGAWADGEGFGIVVDAGLKDGEDSGEVGRLGWHVVSMWWKVVRLD